MDSRENLNLKDLTEYFDARYVRQVDCSARHERTENEIKEISINQAKASTQLSLLIKVSIVILTAVVGVLATSIGTLIFK